MNKPDYSRIFECDSLIWTRERESKRSNCSCKICEVAKASGGAYKTLKLKMLGKGKKKKSSKITSRCGKCLSEVYPGCRHWCTKTQKAENLDAITDEGEKDRIMHSQMKKKIANTEGDEDGFHEITVRTRGRPAVFTVKVGRIKKKRSKVTSYVIRRAQIARSYVK